MRWAVLLLLIFTVFAGCTFAQEAEQFDMNMGAALTRMLVSLGLIIILIIAFVYALKRFFPQIFGSHVRIDAKDKKIEVLDFKPIGQRQVLYFIKVENKKFLISSHERGTSCIGEWKSDSEDSAEFKEVLNELESREK